MLVKQVAQAVLVAVRLGTMAQALHQQGQGIKVVLPQ
jgi:hypothetical protein